MLEPNVYTERQRRKLDELKLQRDDLISKINLQQPVSFYVRYKLRRIGKQMRAIIFGGANA